MADFTVKNEGTIFLLTPQTPEGVAWAEGNIADDRYPQGPIAIGQYIAVEHRYIQPIVEGIKADGLEVA